jgi:hypothetical protein
VLADELRYVYLCEDKLDIEIARAVIEAESNLRLRGVTALRE